jgi:tRNA(Ile)-lysidine synthase
MSADWGIPCVIERGRVLELAAEPGTSPEEAARLIRYRFLMRVAKDNGSTAIATGHTLDDQAETIVMHFLRGSGPDGLRGMLPSQDMGGWVGVKGGEGVLLIRPLLRVRRTQTEGYCSAKGLKPIHDPSNVESDHLRSRLRKELMPLLERYNPAAVETIARMGEIMQGVSSHLGAEVDRQIPRIVRQAGEGAYAIDWRLYLDLDTAVQRELLRQIVGHLRPEMRDVGFSHIESVRDFLTTERQGQRTLPGGLLVERAGGEAILCENGATVEFPQYPQLKPEARIEPDEEIDLDCGWSLDARRVELDEDVKESVMVGEATLTGQWEQVFDLEGVPDDLSLRVPRAGDRFRPLGFQGTMKLSDHFINEGIPRVVRSRWPVLVAGDTILWVVGLRRAAYAKITPSTRSALVIRLHRPADAESPHPRDWGD